MNDLFVDSSQRKVVDDVTSLGYSIFPSMTDEDYVRQEFFLLKSVLIGGCNNLGVASIAFDNAEELIWAGTHTGHVSSFFGLDVRQCSSFRVPEVSSEIRHLESWDQCILSVTSDCLSCSSKVGIPIYQYRSPSVTNLQCGLLSQPNIIYIGGHQSALIEIDIETKTELRQVDVGETGSVILRFSNSYICSGDTSGRISLIDPNSLSVVHVLPAHTGTLSDFDVLGNHLVTCGFSQSNDELTVDRNLMVFDLRFNKSLAPLRMLIDPMFLRFVPTYSDRICVISQTGQFQVLEQGCVSHHSPIYQVPTAGSCLTSFSLSSSNQTLAFGDSAGYLHLFVNDVENPIFNVYSFETEFTSADPHFISTGLTEELNSFPSEVPPYFSSTGPQLVDWVKRSNNSIYRSPARDRFQSTIQNNIYSTAGQREGDDDQSSSNTLLYSQIWKKSNRQDAYQGSMPVDDHQIVVIPKCYRKVEIKYSKLGIDGFDFWIYNKTNFSGLETNIPNAYCNAMLQVLYFILPLRHSLMNHLCSREFCLTCELGFLCHMLQQQTTKTCQATNFLRAFRTIREVTALGLLLSDSDETLNRADLSKLIQNWNRFVLQQIDSELSSHVSNKVRLNMEQLTMGTEPPPSLQVDHFLLENSSGDKQRGLESLDGVENGTDVKNSTIMKQLFAYDMSICLSCKVCGERLSRKASSLIVDLLYPTTHAYVGMDCVKIPFSKIVERSLNFERNTRSWCISCNRYQQHSQSKVLNSLPNILSLNCHLESLKDISFWKNQELIAARSEGGQVGVGSPVVSNHSLSTKPCRYGPSCSRPDCRFKHDKPIIGSLTSVGASGKAGWIPFGLKLTLSQDGKVTTSDFNTHDVKDVLMEEQMNSAYYELTASVAYIKGGKNSFDHLVSHIKVENQDENQTSNGQWYLFNDFAISPVDEALAVRFDIEWKLPCILYFSRRDINTKYNIPVIDPITSDVLFLNESLVTPRWRNVTTFVPLIENELPEEGDVIGLDAEFVKLNPEEAELRSDGTKSTIRPSQMSVARVTCIREKGPFQGVPFIDDYISTQEQVADYLTQFSGIEPGDLDAALSCKHLTTLKSTYLKLRYLISAKVIFVGHGLKKDFRVLNLVVPPDQVVDTVELFHLPKQRMLSLRFLAWYFLGLNIQSKNHDSIEDASTAIRLYYKYNELFEEGEQSLRLALNNLYAMARQLNWRIPEEELVNVESLVGMTDAEDFVTNRVE